jgi:hypothetical protein
MTTATADRLARACVALVAVGIMFAVIGDQRAAMAACGIGAALGIVATWHSPIEPWH